MSPAYRQAYHSGRLNQLAEEATKMLESCCLCPHRCQVNRLKNQKGRCRTGLLPRVFSFMPHHGEEPPVSGERGSGTIFFSGCNMRCVYCQNYQFSQLDEGKDVDFTELADFMLRLQEMGCHNLNLVTPTHVLAQILKSLQIAVSNGLEIPIVYNTGGYELTQVIKLLDGIVDVYLADMRYSDNLMAVKYSQAEDYPLYNQEAVKEMQRQVGVAKINAAGIIEKGLIIRHLVLPNNVSQTEQIMKFIAEELCPDTYISLMSQYFPCYRAGEFKEISRRITFQEYAGAEKAMQKYGLNNGWIQESRGLERFAGTNIKPI